MSGCSAPLRLDATQLTALPHTVTAAPITPFAPPRSPTPQISLTLGTSASLTPPNPIPAVATVTPITAICTPDRMQSGTRYTLDATVDMAAHAVTGSLTVTYRNDTGIPLAKLVFYVPAAHRGQVFTLTSASNASGMTLNALAFNAGRIDAAPQSPIAPGCTVGLTLNFTLKVPPMPDPTLSRLGYLGYSARQLNLGDWLPVVAPYIAGDWYVPRDWPSNGETTVTEAAHYDVTLHVQNADPGKLDVAGPGAVQRLDAVTWRFVLDHARNFAVSLSEQFEKQSIQTADGITIELYGFAHKLPDTLTFALATARDAITRYEALFGDCAYKRLVIVQGDFADGMEFSGIVFVGGGWFAAYDGKPDGWLTLLTAHELSHQWWYSSVGDNQATTPYIDEAFATYSEELYLEKAYPDLVKWWWGFRVSVYQPKGYVDSTVYDFTVERQYINAVYLRGVLMLNDVRSAIGDPAFFQWWRDLARTQADRIASPAALWGLLSPADYAKTAAIRALYLRNPDPLKATPATPSATTAATP